MRVFTVFSKKQVKDYFKDVIYIEEEFSLTAALCGGLWTLYHRMWIASAFIFLGYWLLYLLLYYAQINNDIFKVLCLAFSLYIGSYAKNWYAKSLLSKGYQLKKIIPAKDLEEAQLKYVSEQLDKAIGATS